MTAWIADENFNADITRGRALRLGALDLLTAEGEGLRQVPDPALLAFAADRGRVLLTHDEDTMPKFA